VAGAGKEERMIPCTLKDGRQAILHDVHSLEDAETLIRLDREDGARIAVEVYVFSDDAMHLIRAKEIAALRDINEHVTHDTIPCTAPSL